MPTVEHYPYSLEEPLLWFADRPWRILDALEGTAIIGDTGSGKTSGSGKTIAKAMLHAGFGGLVLCKKIDECDSWVQLATECGRSDQILIVNHRQPWRFNFLDYTFRRRGVGAGFGLVQNDSLVALFGAAGPARRGGASALWNITYDAGTGAGAVGLGAVAQALGYPAAFGVSATALAGVLLLRLRRP